MLSCSCCCCRRHCQHGVVLLSPPQSAKPSLGVHAQINLRIVLMKAAVANASAIPGIDKPRNPENWREIGPK